MPCSVSPHLFAAFATHLFGMVYNRGWSNLVEPAEWPKIGLLNFIDLLMVTCSFCHLYFVKEFPRFGRKISAKIG